MRQNHRRIKRDRLQTIYVKNRTVEKDNEGVPTETFGDAIEKKAEVWAANERRQIETYGDRITNVANVRIQGNYVLRTADTEAYIEFSDGNEVHMGDGVCVNVSAAENPDYRVLTIIPARPVRLEIERI